MKMVQMYIVCCCVVVVDSAQCSSPTCKNLITQAKVFIDKLNQNPAALMCQLSIFKVLLEKNTHKILQWGDDDDHDMIERKELLS